MALYLVQHGKSLSKDVDPDQGLSEEGTAETRRIAQVARDYQVPIAQIKQSGKKRARQTAEIFAGALKPAGGVEEVSGLKPLDDVTAFAANIDAAADTMLVGHLPFMAKLASYLLSDNTDKIALEFKAGGMAYLEYQDNRWILKWLINPDINPDGESSHFESYH